LLISIQALADTFPDFKLVRESEGAFKEQVLALVEEAGHDDLIMWAVDDLVFFRDYDVR
jgi:hypothetical protein